MLGCGGEVVVVVIRTGEWLNDMVHRIVLCGIGGGTSAYVCAGTRPGVSGDLLVSGTPGRRVRSLRIRTIAETGVAPGARRIVGRPGAVELFDSFPYRVSRPRERELVQLHHDIGQSARGQRRRIAHRDGVEYAVRADDDGDRVVRGRGPPPSARHGVLQPLDPSRRRSLIPQVNPPATRSESSCGQRGLECALRKTAARLQRSGTAACAGGGGRRLVPLSVLLLSVVGPQQL
ncbi:hypothetical protein APR08_004048 [Nocardia amikacinitolerans]|nr:hypothetical protein [Nocardia amikacinitolerans]